MPPVLHQRSLQVGLQQQHGSWQATGGSNGRAFGTQLRRAIVTLCQHLHICCLQVINLGILVNKQAVQTVVELMWLIKQSVHTVAGSQVSGKEVGEAAAVLAASMQQLSAPAVFPLQQGKATYLFA